MLRFRDLGASFSIGASFSRFRCFVFEFWVLRFRDLGASFSSFGCFVFEIWVLRASVYVFECFVFETTTLWHAKLDPECLPPIETTDLLSYLVLDTSYYTAQQFKAFKSLEAYNQTSMTSLLMKWKNN